MEGAVELINCIKLSRDKDRRPRWEDNIKVDISVADDRVHLLHSEIRAIYRPRKRTISKKKTAVITTCTD